MSSAVTHTWQTSAAVFLPAALPRDGRVAFWAPDGDELPVVTPADGSPVTGAQTPEPGGAGTSGSGDPGPRAGELTVVRRHGAGVRSRKVPAVILGVAEALPHLVGARHHPAAHPATACWGAAALHALQLIARGRLLPGLTADDLDAWRAGPLDADDIAHLRAVAAAMPPEGHAVPAPGLSPLQLPEPEALVRAFLDAVADTLPRTPAAAHAAGAPFAARTAQHLPRARAWATEAAAGMDAGVRVSLRLDLAGYELFDIAEEGGDERQAAAALLQIAATCAAFEVDGMRADIVMARTATALAAWAGRTEVTSEDVRQAALLALPHRRRRNPFDAPGLDEDKLDETLEQFKGEDGDDDPDPGPDGGPDGGPGGGVPPQGEGPDDSAPQDTRSDETPAPAPGGAGGAGERAAVKAAEPFRTKMLSVPGLGEGAAGRRSRARTEHGRTTGSVRPRGALTKLHLAATVHAAAPHQKARGRTGPGLVVRRDDLRQATREGREGNLVLFAVDASGSMAARQRMSAVKGAVLSLLLDAYQRRDKVGLVTFRGRDAEVALPPTSSVDAAAARLEQLPTGGRTPLSAGLLKAHDVLRVERLRDPSRRPLLVVVTDGRATGGGADPVALAARAARLHASEGTAAVVVDCETGPVRLGLAGELARELGGTAVTLDELRADSIAGLVRDVQAGQTTRRAA
ncbi:VWA domain-containing protein [Streptomyces sp. NPDC059567]|uniref:VWA domain-containing protein n=1 Tax=Streptomyces sp. NPDC059567 TaxID=3346867 RepID=UPI003691F692